MVIKFLLYLLHLRLASAVITDDATVTSFSMNPDPQYALQSALDRNFSCLPLEQKQCASTDSINQQGNFQWMQFSLSQMHYIETIILINNEQTDLTGTSLQILNENSYQPFTHCIDNLQRSGVYQCDGLIGSAIRLYRGGSQAAISICQIRAYSWKPMDSVGVQEVCFDGSCGDLQTSSLLSFPPNQILDGRCYKITNSYLLDFTSPTYVNAITFLGSSQLQFQNADGIQLILYNEDGTLITEYNFQSDQYAYGHEILVQSQCKQIRVKALDDVLYLLYLAVFTTPTSCDEPFVWNPVSPGRFAVGFQYLITFNVEIGATKNGGLCPVALDAYMEDGSDLPEFIRYEASTRTLYIQVYEKMQVDLYTVVIEAFYFTGNSNYRDFRHYSFSIFHIDSLDIDLEASLSFNYESNKDDTGQVRILMPSVIYLPADAEVKIVYSCNSEEVLIIDYWLYPLKNVKSTVQYTITATDQISGLEKSFLLTQYTCEQLEFTISSELVQLTQLEPSQSLTWYQNWLSPQCGTDVVSFEMHEWTADLALADGDGSINWLDIINFSKPMTISYQLEVVAKPHTVIGMFADDSAIDQGLKWYLSTEDTDFMFFDSLTNNKVNSRTGSGALQPLNYGTYQVKVVIGNNKAELFLNDQLYFWANNVKKTTTSVGKVGFQSLFATGSSQIMNFRHLYSFTSPIILSVDASVNTIKVQSIDLSAEFVQKVQARIMSSDGKQIMTIYFNVTQSKSCSVKAIEFQPDQSNLLVCTQFAGCSINLPTVTQVPACGLGISYEIIMPAGQVLPDIVQIIGSQLIINNFTGADIGLYALTITASLDENPIVDASMRVGLAVGCLAPYLEFQNTINNTTYQVGNPALSLDITAQIIKTCPTSLSFAHSFMVNGNPELPAFLTYNDGKLIVSSQSNSDVGTYQVKVIVYLVDLPTLFSTIEFELSLYCEQLSVSLEIPEIVELLVSPESSTLQVLFLALKCSEFNTTISYSIDYEGLGMTLFKEGQTSGHILLDGTKLTNTTYTVVLTAKYENRETSKSFVVQVKYICVAQMLPKEISFSLNAFIGQAMIFSMPNITDSEDLLMIDNERCGKSKYLLSGDITSIGHIEMVENRPTLHVNSLLSTKIGTYIGEYTRDFETFNLSFPLQIVVSSPFAFEDLPITTNYELFDDLQLNFRRVTYSASAVDLLFKQIDYLGLNSWYSQLLKIYKERKLLSEGLRETLLSNLDFEHQISPGDSSFSSKLTHLNSTSFLFQNDDFTDLNRTQSLLQTTLIRGQGLKVSKLVEDYGRIKIVKSVNCLEFDISVKTKLEDMYSKLGFNTTQFFIDATASKQETNQDYTADPAMDVNMPQNENNQDSLLISCGPMLHQLVLSGTEIPAPPFMTIQNQMIVISPLDPTTVGHSYLIDLKVTLANYPSMVSRQSFKVLVYEAIETIDEETKINSAPIFKGYPTERALPEQIVILGIPQKISLPKIVDEEDDPVNVKVEFGHQELSRFPFLDYDKSKDIVTLNLPKEFPDRVAMLYVTLSDERKANIYNIPLTVHQAPEETLPETDDFQLEKQVMLPQFITDFFQPKETPQQKRQMLELAQKSCVPKQVRANEKGEVFLVFENEISFNMTDAMLQKVKEAGSVQVQLLKADGEIMSRRTDFRWNITQYNSFTLKFAISFEDPTQISATSYGRDYVRIVFEDMDKFLTCPFIFDNSRELAQSLRQRMVKSIPKGYQVSISLPAQKWATKELAAANQTNAQIVTQSIIESHSIKNSAIFQVLLNYFNGLSGSVLWGGINAMQLISCSALFNLVLPPNSNVIFMQIRNLTSFDIYNPIEKHNISGFTETGPFNENFDDLGYGSLNFFDSMGSLTIIMVLILLLQLLAPLLQFAARKSKKPATRHGRIIQALHELITKMRIFKENRYTVVNTWLRFLLECYLELIIAAVLAFYSPQFILKMTKGDKIALAGAYITAIILGVFTTFVAVLITCLNRRRVGWQKVKAKLQRASHLLEFFLLIQKSNEEAKQKEKEKDFIKAFETNSSKKDESLFGVPAVQDFKEKSSSSSQVFSPTINVLPLGEDSEVLETERALIVDEEDSKYNDLREHSIFTNSLSRELQIPVIQKKSRVPSQRIPIRKPLYFQRNQHLDIQVKIDDQIEDSQGPYPRQDGSHNPSFLSINQHISVEEVKIQIQQPFTKFMKQMTNITEKPRGRLILSPDQLSPAGRVSKQPHSGSGNSGLAFLKKAQEKSEATPKSQLPRRQSKRSVFASVYSRNSRVTANSKKSERLVRKSKLTLIVQEAELLQKLYRSNTRDKQQYFQNMLFRAQKEFNQKQEDLEKRPYLFNFKYVKVLQDGMRKASHTTNAYHLIFVVRRLLLVVAAFSFRGVASMQCLTFLVGSMMMVTYLVAVNPFSNRFDNLLEIYNESFVLLISIYYVLLTQTNFNVHHFRNMGIVFNVTIGLMFVSNMLLLFYQTVISIKKGIQRALNFIKLRRRAKVRDGDTGELSNRFLYRKANGHYRYAYYPIEDVPEEGDLNWLFETTYDRWVKEDFLKILRRFARQQTTDFSNTRLQDFYDSEEGTILTRNLMNTIELASISDVKIKFFGNRTVVRPHDLLEDQPKVKFSSSEVDPSDITIQLSHRKDDGCEINEQSNKNFETLQTNKEQSNRNFETPSFQHQYTSGLQLQSQQSSSMFEQKLTARFVDLQLTLPQQTRLESLWLKQVNPLSEEESSWCLDEENSNNRDNQI